MPRDRRRRVARRPGVSVHGCPRSFHATVAGSQKVPGMRRDPSRGIADIVLALHEGQRRGLPAGSHGEGAIAPALRSAAPAQDAPAPAPGGLGPCVLCSLGTAHQAAETPPRFATIVWRDEHLLALTVAGHPGVLLVPRRHATTLWGHFDSCGALLGAIRRAVRAVECSGRDGGVVVEPLREVARALGHICYWVRPARHRAGARERPEALLRALA